jgi:hypothetical protein
VRKKVGMSGKMYFVAVAVVVVLVNERERSRGAGAAELVECRKLRLAPKKTH